MEKPFIEENRRERQRLQALVGRITDEELKIPMWRGWTIATVLAHLAFWDQRALVLMRKWKETRVAPSPIDQDVANEALLPLLNAIPPRTAANLSVSAAEGIDLELETASDHLIDDMAKLGDRFRLYRSDHRKIHLDQMDSRLCNDIA
jgi:hypothetical protein